ncbi:hypothetical protein B4900_09630 [Yersinia rohdei]|nr:hypothetical protein B4900_09630 [Yersinia rohdei]
MHRCIKGGFSWAKYGWFNNSVDGEDLAREEYKSEGRTTSIESGYTFKMVIGFVLSLLQKGVPLKK